MSSRPLGPVLYEKKSHIAKSTVISVEPGLIYRFIFSRLIATDLNIVHSIITQIFAKAFDLRFCKDQRVGVLLRHMQFSALKKERVL